MINIVSQISVHQEHELLVKLGAAGLTGQLAQKVIESRGNTLAKDIVALIRGPQPAFPSYAVHVDYGQTVEQFIRDGRYDWVNSDITAKCFPMKDTGKKEETTAKIIHFNHSISSLQITKCRQ